MSAKSQAISTPGQAVAAVALDAAERASLVAHEASDRAKASAERAKASVLQSLPGSQSKATWEHVALYAFIILPTAAFLAAIPMLWGSHIGPVDLILFAIFYGISAHGITVGFHRYFTHGSFKANRGLKIGLAIAGSLAVQGPITRWVADHRRHHAFSDQEGDPHSPWVYGGGTKNIAKGFWHSHMGWLFDPEQTNQQRFAPDLLADPDIQKVDHHFPTLVVVTMVLPGLLGGLITWSWVGGLQAFFWASLVRVFLLHHVTWSINSICHIVGKKPFASRDQSRNVWPLAVLSMGESWHNLHHAEPTAARHGVDRGQIDSSARLIWTFEKLGWATDVKWAKPARLATKRTDSAAAKGLSEAA